VTEDEIKVIAAAAEPDDEPTEGIDAVPPAPPVDEDRGDE
jgi:hypothetical protein